MGRAKFPIYLMLFPTGYLLSSTFMRPQEYYESPRFRGKVFSWEEFMDWYAKEHGSFTYLTDWDQGFNIPSWILDEFRDKFTPATGLTKKEQRLVDTMQYVPRPFYLIGGKGTKKEVDKSTLKHEFAHGLFYWNSMYRVNILNTLRAWNIPEIKGALRKHGYCDTVINDEAHAYILTGLNDLDIRDRDYRHIRRMLDGVFRECFGFSLIRASKNDIFKLIHTIRMR